MTQSVMYLPIGIEKKKRKTKFISEEMKFFPNKKKQRTYNVAYTFFFFVSITYYQQIEQIDISK